MWYYLHICRSMWSNDNPKNLFRKGTYCNLFKIFVEVLIMYFIGIFIMISIGITYAYVRYRDIYDIYTGCAFDTSISCNYSINKDICHVESNDGILYCFSTALWVIPILIICLLMRICINQCKQEITDSYESAYTLTEIRIDKINQHLNDQKERKLK